MNLPPSSEEWLDLELSVLERIFYDREVEKQRASIVILVQRGGTITDLSFLLTLRQLVSHPQISAQLGYGDGKNCLTFQQLFSQLVGKAEAELNEQRMTFVASILQLAFGQEAYAERSKHWTGGAPQFDEKELKAKLSDAQTICEKALKLIDEREREGADQDGKGKGKANRKAKGRGKGKGKAKPASRAVANLMLKWPEALYWCEKLLGRKVDEPEVRLGGK